MKILLSIKRHTVNGKRFAFVLPFLLFAFCVFISPAYAQDPQYDPGTSAGKSDGLFGKINPPAGVTPGVAGLGNLVGAMLRLLVIVAGVWALFNIILAGYQFIQAGGDSKAVAGAWARIWQSLVGIIIVAASFLFAAIIGQIFFGSPTAILSPKLITP